MANPSGLRFIADLIKEWLDWSSVSRSKERLSTDGDTAIMSLPVPFWPKHAQMEGWIETMKTGADHIDRLNAALAEWSVARKDAIPASPETWTRLAKAEGALQALANEGEKT